MSDMRRRGPRYTGRFASWLSLIGRLVAGQIFIFAGLNKVVDPQGVADAINGFGLINNDTLITVAAYVMPWTEIIAGVLLVAGLFSRAAATIIILLLAAFVGAILNAIDQGKVLDCGCFGDLKLFCTGQLGNCNVVQNGILAAFALLPLVIGGGRASADALLQPDDSGFGGPEIEEEAFD